MQGHETNRLKCISKCVGVFVLLLSGPELIFANGAIEIPSNINENATYTMDIESNANVQAEKHNRTNNLYRGENALPPETGYIILGVLAVGLCIVAVLILNNASHSLKMPDP